MKIKIYYYLWEVNGPEKKIIYQGKEFLTENDIEQIIVDKWENDELPMPFRLDKENVVIQVDIDEVTI